MATFACAARAGVAHRRASVTSRKPRNERPRRLRAADPDADAAPEDSGDEAFARVRQIKSERRRARAVCKTRVDDEADEDSAVIAVEAASTEDDFKKPEELSDVLHGPRDDNRDRLLSSVNRNLALEMVRVTESAAVAAARWLGKGDKMAADAAAVRAMRAKLKEVDFEGVVVVGEGAKDQAPMLFPGECVGSGAGPRADVAVDPLDGTSLIAGGKDGAIAVIAIAERGAMFDPGPVAFYVDKIAVGPEAAGHVNLSRSPTVNVHAIAKAKRKAVADVTCAVLDRERHVGLVEELRLAGARIKLIADGDVEAALATCDPESGVDALFGVGGAAEGVAAAAALRCAGGEMQAQLWPRDAADAAAMRAAGCDLTRVLRTEDLCGGGRFCSPPRASPTAARSAACASARAARGAARWSCGSPAARCAASRPSTPGSARAGRPWRARWTKTSTSAYTTRGEEPRSPARVPSRGERPTDETRLKNERRG